METTVPRERADPSLAEPDSAREFAHRREIDGVRAVAVVPVILFHAGFESFSGGYVGVDVFFVISGFLISSIILHEHREGRFHLGRFYERRARRILPALFLVLLCCLPFAWAWMLPSDMDGFARSLVATTSFWSNIHFWRESGYFSAENDLAPLLHTWSLAVEEQFYLLYPLVLIILLRLPRALAWWALVLASLASLGLAQWAAMHKPDAAFYLLPPRAWELLAGAMLAFACRDRFGQSLPAPRSATARGALALAGLALIAGSIVLFDSRTVFPGVSAIAPVAGTLLVLAYADERSRVGRLLASPALVGLGLVSYGAYLWHQPLLAFARLHRFDEPPGAMLAALCVAAFLLAWASWRYVERPFREPGRIGRAALAVVLGAAGAGFVAYGLVGDANGGFRGRFGPEALRALDEGERNFRETLKVYGLRECFIDTDQTHETLVRGACVAPADDRPRVVVYGDSHAAHLMEGVRRQFDPGAYRIDQWTAVSCRAFDHSRNTTRCREFQRTFVRDIVPALPSGSFLIVSSQWLNSHEGLGELEFRQALRTHFAEISRAGLRVLLVGHTPDFPRSPFEYQMRFGREQGGEVFLPARDFRPVNEVLADEARRAGIEFADPTLAACQAGSRPSCRVKDPKGYWYFDSTHLSRQGSEAIMRAVLQGRPTPLPGTRGG